MSEVMELAIDPGPEPGTYVVRVLRSLSGDQPTATIELDVDALFAGLPALESSVLASSVSARRVMTERETALQSTGSRLFETVFSGAIGTAYRASAAVAAERGRPMQIALQLSAPGLAAIPWEALFDPVSRTYVSRREPLVRWVPGRHDPRPTVFQPPLRILGMIAAPRNLATLDVEAERARLEEALRAQIDAGQVELTWLEDASWHGVQGALLSREWHVLHFVGHGGYDVVTDEGLLALVGADGRADFVSASRLADLLDEADPTPRLVVLNSCQSGAAGATDVLSGTAAALVHSGIRAVAAMQFAITDAAAIAFSRSFYTSLANGRPVGAAVRSGRIGILGISAETLEWVTPVLYLRGDDARLLDAAPPVVRGAPLAASAAPPLIAAAEPEPDLAMAFGPVADAASEPPAFTGPGPAATAAPEPSTSPGPASEPPVTVPTDGAASVPDGPDADVATSAGPDALAAAAADASDAPGATSAGPDAPASSSTAAATTTPEEVPRPPSRRRWGVIAAMGAGVLAVAAAAVLLLPRVFAPPADPSATASESAAASEGPVPSESTGPTPSEVLPVSLAVPADQQWTTTGVSCAPGDVLAIAATGVVLHSPDPASTVTPDGLEEEWFHQFNVPGLPDANTAGLIGSLDQEQAFFVVGSGVDYECPRAGELFLGINDRGLEGNSGAWTATIDRADAG